MLKNGLIGKIRLISKCMTSQPKKKIIAIQKFSNISKSKGNQTVKHGRLIELFVNQVVMS